MDDHALYSQTLRELRDALIERDHLRAQVAELERSMCLRGPKCPAWKPVGLIGRLRLLFSV